MKSSSEISRSGFVAIHCQLTAKLSVNDRGVSQRYASLRSSTRWMVMASAVSSKKTR